MHTVHRSSLIPRIIRSTVLSNRKIYIYILRCAQEGRLSSLPGRIRDWQRQEGGCRELFGSLQSSERHRNDRATTDPSHSFGTSP